MAAGDYTVTIFDQMGDSLVRIITLIGPSAGLDAQISNMTTVNNGLITGGLNAMVNGGVPPYSYVWKKDGNVLTNTWSYLSVSQTGTYSLVVTDATSGMDSATVVISLPEDTTMEAAAPPAWGMYGNAGNGDILEGEGAPWFGTADSTDVVMKANGNERIRLHADGNTAVKDTLVTEHLRVTGTTRIDSIQSRHIRAERITSMMPGDSLIFFGDSSIVFNHQQHHIFAYNHYRTVIGGSPGQAMDLKIQCQPQPLVGSTPGTNHTFLNANRGNVGIGIGFGGQFGAPAAKLHVAGDVRITGTKLHVAQNGNVGIGTNTPDARLDIRNSDGGPALSVENAGVVAIGPFLTETSPNATLYLGDDRNHYIQSNWNEGLSFSTYGAVDAMVIQENTGKVGIGVGAEHIFGEGMLEVNGTIRSRRVVVELTGWPDFVFAQDYRLRSLSEVEKFIKESGHLPDVPSAKEIETNGLDLGDLVKLQMRKIEELTLYVIDLEKKLEQKCSGQTKLID